jgi:hypothetical protein
MIVQAVLSFFVSVTSFLALPAFSETLRFQKQSTITLLFYHTKSHLSRTSSPPRYIIILHICRVCLSVNVRNYCEKIPCFSHGAICAFP